MKNLKTVLTFAFIGATSLVFSQKDAPVVGNTVRLVQLLNTNYSSISPEQRAEKIILDRAEAIQILKAYLPEQNNNALFSEVLNKKADEIQRKSDAAYDTYLKKKKGIESKVAERAQAIGFKPGATPAVSENELSGMEESLTAYRNHLYTLDSIHFLDMKEAFSNNSYLKYIVQELHNKHSDLQKNALDTRVDQALSLSLQKGFPFIGGDLNFTTAIDGLSRFLATRIKEELTTYVIDKVKEWLENPSDESLLNELKILLPRTTDYLQQFRADQMLNFGDEIKQYIEEDLNDLLENLPNLRNTMRFQRLLEMHPDLDFAFEALELIPQLSKMKRPTDYFDILENSRTLNAWNASENPLKQNITNAIDLTCLLARSFTTRENDQLEVIALQDVRSYLEDNTFYLVYFGLLYQQNVKYYNVKFRTSIKHEFTVVTVTKNDTVKTNYAAINDFQTQVPLSSIMAQMMSTFDSTKIEELSEMKSVFGGMISNIGLLGERVNTTAMALKKKSKAGEKIPIELAHEFVSAILDFSDGATMTGDSLINYLLQEIAGLKIGIKTVTIDKRTEVPTYSVDFGSLDNSQPARIDIYDKVNPYITVAKAVNDIILDVHNENFATALLKALELTTALPDNRLSEISNALQDLTKIGAQLNNDDLSLLVSAKSGHLKGEKFKQLKKKFEQQAALLDQALTKWMFFFRGNYAPNPELENQVNAVKAVLVKIKKGDASKIAASEIEAFTALAANKTFQKLLISYYANKNLDKIGDELSVKLKTLKVTIKGDEVNLFTDAEANDFKTLVESYVSSSINWALAAKNEKEDAAEKMNELHEELEGFIAKYAFAFPQKLTIDPNSPVFKLIHFVNDMAKAKTAEDVENAIEAFALPSGSFAIKRTAKFNVSVNSYPGLLAGAEMSNISGATSSSMTASFTAPVGLSFAWGTEKCGSFGAFLPVVDIAAFTRVHLDSDTNTFTLPEVNFGNVFSPGLYLSYGFKKSPLSINLGGQFGPELRRVEANGEVKSYESWRIGAGLVLDIPLFNLYTKPRFDYK